MNDVPVNSEFSEIVAYNNKDFPAYIKKGLLSSYPNYRATCHWHTDLEFIYVYAGKMDYSVNGTIICLSAGEGIFVNSRCLHYGFSNEHNECSFLCILLHPDLLSSNSYFTATVLSPFLNNKNLPYIHLLPSVLWQNQILKFIYNMEFILNKQNEALEIIQSFTNILHVIITNMGSLNHISQNQSDLHTLTIMVGYIQQHFAEKITVTDLTRIGSCCKTKCNTLFSDYMNTSPISYIINYRLEKSIDLLLNTSHTVTEIAYLCGFGSVSYYCETFLKQYGVSPKKYKNNSLDIMPHSPQQLSVSRNSAHGESQA